jgi:hypothetical protein
MKKILFPLTFLTFLGFASVDAKPESFLFGSEDSLHIIVNNRILAKVNGKAISVVDVMKKMDILFYRQFPEYTASIPARFQFYQVNWKHIISDLIDKELIIADAEENKLPLTNGDIRQEMESLFGPNIIVNLDKIGMTYDEAWSIVKGDITLRRMLYFKVNSKAMRELTPQSLRLAYNDFAKDNINPAKWTYQVISVRDSEVERGKKAAEEIQKNLEIQKFDVQDYAKKIKEESSFGKDTIISFSEEFNHTEKDMSAAYKDIVLKLSPKQFSEAIAQKSRADQSTLFRIFYLKETQAEGVSTFSEVESTIKEKLLNNAVEKETVAYLKKLREHFDVQESHLTDLSDEEYQPFSMK